MSLTIKLLQTSKESSIFIDLQIQYWLYVPTSNYTVPLSKTSSEVLALSIRSRCLMVSTSQADPSCFYFRIMNIDGRMLISFFCPLHLMQGLRSLEHWLLQKLSMTILDQKFRFLIKTQVFLCCNISKTWIFWPLKIQL